MKPERFETLKKGMTINDFEVIDILGNQKDRSTYKAIITRTKEPVILFQALKSSWIGKIEPELYYEKISKKTHKNLVKILKIFEEAPNFFVVYEYCAEGNLEDFALKNKENMDESRALQIIKQLTDGYSELYNEGINHGNIKPSNIYLSGSNAWKLGNFCSFHPEETRPEEKFYIKSSEGTKLPQQNTKADIWSLGAVLYFILHQKTVDFSQTPNYQVKANLSQFCMHFLSICLQKQSEHIGNFETVTNHPFLKGAATCVIQGGNLESQVDEAGNKMLILSISAQLVGMQLKPHSLATIMPIEEQKQNECKCKTLKQVTLSCKHSICIYCASIFALSKNSNTESRYICKECKAPATFGKLI